MPNDTRAYVAKYVEDLHALVTHGLRPISRQVDEAHARDHTEAAALIADLQRTLTQHERLLSDHLRSLGSSPSTPTTGVQDAAAAIAGMVAGLYNQMRSEAVSKSVRDDYTFMSHCAVSWLMLMSTARSLGEHETEELAEQGYRDCSRLVMEIDRVMPGLVVQELQQDGFSAQPVADWAHHIVSDAWNRQQVNSGVA